MPQPNVVTWTSTISSFLRTGHAELALREFFRMCNSGIQPNEYALSLSLKASRLAAEPAIGKLVHGYAIKTGYESYDFCSTSILDMYAKFNRMTDARILFDSVPRNCVALWNTMIDGYARSGNSDEALHLFRQMPLVFILPNSYTYTILVKLSADAFDLGLLRFLHGCTIKTGHDEYSFVGGALLDAYGKCGRLSDSIKMFRTLKQRDHVVWTALLAGFRNNGDSEQGIHLYLEYVAEGYRLDSYMFANVFNLCAGLGKNATLGCQVHACFAKSGFVLDSFTESALIKMYASSGMVDEAYLIFFDATDKNEVTYSVMIRGFVCDCDYVSAVRLYREMRTIGHAPDGSMLSSMLRAMTGLDMWEQGRSLHSLIVKLFGESNVTIGNNLIEMYSYIREVDKAAKVFMAMEVHNEFSWTSLIFGYIETERYDEAIELYNRMMSSGSTEPSEFTLVGILQASSKLQDLQAGQQTHSYILKKGFQSHTHIESALIAMYSKCGRIEDASRIFSTMSEWDFVSWSSMIASYAQNGHGEKALKLFAEYNNGSNCNDESVLSSCISACSSLTALDTGRAMHAVTIKTGYESDLQVGSTIVDMYCKCGCINEARNFFDEMRAHSVVSYTAMLCGFAHHGLGHEALGVFNRMKEAGVKPDGVTLVGVLSACSHVGLVEEGREYFESITTEYGLEKSAIHYACVVDLLGRSGRVAEAEELISDAPLRSKALLWRTLLGACRVHGDVEDGNRIAKMLIGLEPDEPSNYVMLSNILASGSMWDHSSELKQRMQRGHMKKTPGISWIELAC